MSQSGLVAALASLPGVSAGVLEALRRAAAESGVVHCALVGGTVRDLLLHRLELLPWSGISDFDLVVEGDLPAFVRCLTDHLGPQRLTAMQWHDSFGTVSLTADGVSLDLAMARQELYPSPAENPVVRPGTLASDLVRRDFSINAMALDLRTDALIDPHGGQAALQARCLAFLHSGSVTDDPTRVIRAARYSARLGLDLLEESRRQLDSTLEDWPWPRDRSSSTWPPALSTRLRMELDRLFSHEPWAAALDQLSSWQAMPLIDAGLQVDPRRCRRLRQAQRLGLPLMPAWLAAASQPVAVAERLQIPAQQVQWLMGLETLRLWLRDAAPSDAAPPSQWTVALETGDWPVQSVALMICLHHPSWRMLWRWWARWRHIQSPVKAKDLMAQGWSPGPGLGAELRRRRGQALDGG
ncbi:MAG: tRNA nucleotidyltransferase [Synechococcus sp. ARS1019]|nr:tRNA nucleotidyltransferase [Synechococcus sp. ARS1019]